jgi:hypothetical protein
MIRWYKDTPGRRYMPAVTFGINMVLRFLVFLNNSQQQQQQQGQRQRTVTTGAM